MTFEDSCESGDGLNSDDFVPMTGEGLNIVKPKSVLPTIKRGGSIRGLRSVASNAEPLNKLRELSFDPTREINLANLLFRRKLINKLQLDEVILKLNDAATNFASLVPISVLFELQDIELVNMESIMNFLVEETKIPFINLKSFRIDSDLFTKLPPDIAERLGVVLFGVVGRSMQIALLNPFDKLVRIAISDYLDCRELSFFLVDANDITPVYDKLREQLADL